MNSSEKRQKSPSSSSENLRGAPRVKESLIEEGIGLEPWSIVEKGFSGTHVSHYESLFCVGNGFLGVRGFFEEGYDQSLSPHTVRSLYLNGFHDTAPIHYPKVGYGWAKVHEAMLSYCHSDAERVAEMGLSSHGHYMSSHILFESFEREMDREMLHFRDSE